MPGDHSSGAILSSEGKRGKEIRAVVGKRSEEKPRELYSQGGTETQAKNQSNVAIN